MPRAWIVLVEVAAFPAAFGADDLTAAEMAGLPAARCGDRGVGHLMVLSAAVWWCAAGRRLSPGRADEQHAGSSEWTRRLSAFLHMFPIVTPRYAAC